MAAPVVAVVGLKSLQRDLVKMGADRSPLNKALSAAGRQAAEPVAALTRGRLPQDSGRLAGDVRVTASRTGAAVRMGRSNLRYAGWVEFGGHRKTPHPSDRDYDSRGRYLFPAALLLASTSARIYSDGVARGLDSYDWTNAGSDPGGVHD